MKKIIQNLKSGETILEEVPAPRAEKGQVLIRTRVSVVSLGTEKMLVEFGKANLVAKARQQPDKVKMVLDKIKADGLVPTMEAVFKKLDQPLPLGYCNAGEVVAVGEGVTRFQIGDRVASNGSHAEFVAVPENLVAHIPENVSYEQAAFTVIGSIGLQGIRLCNPTLGETIVVVGLGLIGLITAELLRANGCRVVGIDFDNQKVELARQKGITAINPNEGNDPVAFVSSFTGEVGADGVIITASTKSNEVISQAAQMSRQRGRIILVGVIGLELNRAEFYQKELTFQVSCSYGPGRYDDDYELKGQDYPLGFVRWTENRNFQAVLFAISQGALQVDSLITEKVALQDYQQIYGQMGQGGSIASLLHYEEDAPLKRTVRVSEGKYPGQPGQMAIVGAGNFTKMTMLPALQKAGAPLRAIVSAGGLSGTTVAQKYGIEQSTTDFQEVLSDPEVAAVLITTRHNLHAEQTRQALEAGKDVFVEKPLALPGDNLQALIEAKEASGKMVMVGFNRRFSPYIRKMKAHLGEGPISVVATMNAGHIPKDVWVHDLKVGGGRIVGEACHYIDLITYLSGSKVVSVHMEALGQHPEEHTDTASLLLKYENGSLGVINYFANGHNSYAKERVETYAQGRTFVMDNFRSLTGYGVRGLSKSKGQQDKGHQSQFAEWTRLVAQGGEPLIPFEEILNTTRASFKAIESLKSGQPQQVES